MNKEDSSKKNLLYNKVITALERYEGADKIEAINADDLRGIFNRNCSGTERRNINGGLLQNYYKSTLRTNPENLFKKTPKTEAFNRKMEEDLTIPQALYKKRMDI